jgi:hypothetical protein
MARFWEYKLKAEILCLGERVKKATFRPSVRTIPSTQISGALRAVLGREVWAIGYFDEDYLKAPKVRHIVHAPRDVATGVSKIPLIVEVLADVRGRVFVEAWAEEPEVEHQRIELVLGAFRSKGLGRCSLCYSPRPVDMGDRQGELLSRLPEEDKGRIGIKEVIKPLYGYLFKPDSDPAQYAIGGHYVRALLEGSIVRGYAFIVR